MKQKDTIAGVKKTVYWNKLRSKSLQKKPLKRTAIKKKKYKINKRTKKLSVNERIHAVLKKDFLLDNPICQCGRDGCERPAVDVHHKKGRGKYLNVVEFFLAVARVCHDWIEAHPKEAKAIGLSLNRLSK